MRNRFINLIGLVILIIASTTRADDLFSVDAVSSTNKVTAGSSSLINLVDHLSSNSNQFAPLSGQSFNANLNYAGINNAFKFQQSFDTSGNRILSFQVPSVGLNQTFSSANGDLNTQLRDYLKKDGLADLTQFQAVVDHNSFAGLVDGNPLSATAMLQDAGYQESALHQVPFDADGKRLTSDGNAHFTSRFWFNGGVLDAGGTSGSFMDLTIALEAHFNQFIGLSFTTPLRYEKSTVPTSTWAAK